MRKQPPAISAIELPLSVSRECWVKSTKGVAAGNQATLSALHNCLKFEHGPFSDADRQELIEFIVEDLIPMRLEVGDIGRNLFEGIVSFCVDPETARYGETQNQNRATP